MKEINEIRKSGRFLFQFGYFFYSRVGDILLPFLNIPFIPFIPVNI
jgi:hypothetical protein